MVQMQRCPRSRHWILETLTVLVSSGSTCSVPPSPASLTLHMVKASTGCHWKSTTCESAADTPQRNCGKAHKPSVLPMLRAWCCGTPTKTIAAPFGQSKAGQTRPVFQTLLRTAAVPSRACKVALHAASAPQQRCGQQMHPEVNSTDTRPADDSEVNMIDTQLADAC